MMSDGSPCGAFGLSELQETELVRVVASTLGTSLEASRIALEASQYDAEDAIGLLTHAQWVSPVELSQESRAASMRDLSQIVVDVCNVEMETAAAVLKATGYDAGAAIDMLTLGQWNPDAVSSLLPVNNSSCCEHRACDAEDVSLSPTCAAVSQCQQFVQGQYACYLRTGEKVQVVSVHIEEAGAQYDMKLQLFTVVPVSTVLHGGNHRRHS